MALNGNFYLHATREFVYGSRPRDKVLSIIW